MQLVTNGVISVFIYILSLLSLHTIGTLYLIKFPNEVVSDDTTYIELNPPLP